MWFIFGSVVYMKTNYVIATYNGRTKRAHSHPVPADVLKTHLTNLQTSMSSITQVTIMVAKSPNYYEDYYDIQSVANTFSIPVKIIRCENYGYSMGQWLKAYEIYRNEFDRYIFTEDDYCPGMPSFDKIILDMYLEKFPHQIGILCALVEGSKDFREKGGYPIHWEGFVCASAKTLHELYAFHRTSPRELLDKIDSDVCPGFDWGRQRAGYIGGYYQLAFSHLFTLAGIEHEDYLDEGKLQFPYWSDIDNQIRFYDKGDIWRKNYTLDQIYRSPIIPVQLACRTFIAHHTHLLDEEPPRGPSGSAGATGCSSLSNRRKVIFIIGMHRCGTSLLSQCLVNNGFEIGKTKNNDKDWQNPNGYYENDRLTDLHNKLLFQNDSCWWNYAKSYMLHTAANIAIYRDTLRKEFEGCTNILIKDPRLTPFSDFLLKVCDKEFEPYFLFLKRNKEECCRSLHLSQRLAMDKCETLYDKTMSYTDHIENHLLIDHKDIITNNKEVIKRISEFCSIPLKDTSNLVDMSLYRVRSSNDSNQ